MFILVSLDFGGSTAVAIHAVTADEKAARDAFVELNARFAEHNAKGEDAGYGMLVELVESTRDFVCPEGLTLFWTQRTVRKPDGSKCEDHCGGPRNDDARYREAGLRVVLSNNGLTGLTVA
jgi:hypothetical protein